jgi:superfamily I DNA/RNA helicase
MAVAVREAARVLARFPSAAVVAVPDQVGSLHAHLQGRHVPTAPLGQPPTAGRLSVLEPAQAKGLEFDAVVVVDPAAFLAQPSGAGLLYIAMTRAVQHLSVVHADADPLPWALPLAS